MKILQFFYLCCIVFMLSNLAVYAQNQQIETVIQERGEAVVKIVDFDKNLLPIINKNASIDEISENNLILYLNAAQFQKMQALELNIQLDAPYYASVRALTMANSLVDMGNWDKYPTWDVFQDMMLEFANNYPEICRLDTIGFSEEGRALLVVKISDNVNVDEIEPEFFLSGQMHGDELVSYFLPLRMIDYLLSNYGSNDQVDNLVNNLELWINPLSNPDGTYGNSETDVSGATRYNANGVDMNRNFPDPNGAWNPDGNETAAENVAMMNFAAERHFVMAANSHSGAEVVNYPWDCWEELHADDDWLYEISRKYADTVHANAPSGYMTLQDDGITNGYAWYSIDGGRQDYFNYYEHCREVTLEWSDAKLLDAEELPAHWNYNRNALLNYFAEALEGVHGIVTDSITDEPLFAEVFIEAHDERNTQVYSELPNGDYHRFLSDGEWDLTFSAEGYKSKIINVNLSQDERIDLDVQLVPLSELPPYAEFSANNTIISCNPEVQFFNESEAGGDLSFTWDFGDGAQSNEENPLHTYMQNGNYTVSLSLSNENGTDEIVKAEYIQVQLQYLDSVHSDAVCFTSSGSVELAAYSEGDIYWFENIMDESPIASGQTYTTPELTASHAYYAQAIFEGAVNYVGEPDNSEDGDYDNTDVIHYLVFDVFDDCTLQEVTVYAENAGEQTIYLRSNSGEVLQEKTLNIDAGEQTIVLDFNLQAGEDYQLAASANSGLYKGRLSWTSVFDYPYEIENLISVNDSDSGVGWGSSEQVYPYFYNWKIKAANCQTERTPVFAIIGDEVQSDLTYEIDGLSVAFDNNSLYYMFLLWNFDDGSSSTEISPTHVFSSPGAYNVTLIMSNECSEITHVIHIELSNSVVENSQENSWQIYPNPAHQTITFELLDGSDYQKVELIDVTGEIIRQENIQSKEITWSVDKYQTGIYFVRFFRKDGNVEHQKIIIKH
ncbi:MAG: M14 family zinc carboxypeptidase [Bacteroidota bacterium]|nr:M14 family zinc carboxypeptidase [Bacteroidota bacterium]